MIIRTILQNPELASTMDLFSDYKDTLSWLRRCPPSEKRQEAIRRMLQAKELEAL
jgi:hypothetical protein